MVTNWLEGRSRFLFCYLKTKPTMAHKAKRNSWEVTWAALTQSLSRLFFLSLSLFLARFLSFSSFSCRLWPSRIGDEIEIVTHSRVLFVHTSTSCHRGAQLHRRPIVPQSRFVTVTYTIRRNIPGSAEVSDGRSALLFPVLFARMSGAFSNWAACFHRGVVEVARCCPILHRWEPLAHKLAYARTHAQPAGIIKSW